MNYLGNKTKLNEWIYASVKDFINEYEAFSNELSFADLFSGTASVSNYWNSKEHEVMSNDIQFYSYVKANSLLKNKMVRKTIIDKIMNELNEVDAKKLKAKFITKNYSPYNKQKRMFFTVENAKIIDYAIELIKCKKNNKEINEQERMYLISELIDAASRVSNTAVVYEAFLKSFKPTSLKRIVFKNKIKNEKTNNNKSEIYNEDINKLINKIKGDILYLDPPYNSRGYDTNYHLLETIALGDEPKIINVSGRRDESKKKSKFSTKSFALETMKDLLVNSNFRYVFISYNNEGIITEDQMIEIINENEWEFKVYKKKYPRFKSNNNEGPKYVEEILYAIKKVKNVNKK